MGSDKEQEFHGNPKGRGEQDAKDFREPLRENVRRDQAYKYGRFPISDWVHGLRSITVPSG